MGWKLGGDGRVHFSGFPFADGHHEVFLLPPPPPPQKKDASVAPFGRLQLISVSVGGSTLMLLWAQLVMCVFALHSPMRFSHFSQWNRGATQSEAVKLCQPMKTLSQSLARQNSHVFAMKIRVNMF